VKHVLLLLAVLVSFSASAFTSHSVALTRVCSFRFQDPSDLEGCRKLADEFAKIVKVQQRMYQPLSADWNPNQPFFETPTVYWVQKFEDASQRNKARLLDKKLRILARKADWHTCFYANIVAGDFSPSPITVTTVNNYFPNTGKLNDALQIRLKVSEMMAAADACPPIIIVPSKEKRSPIGFLGIYEVKDEAQAKICHERQYAPDIIREVNKITPLLSGFARMRSSLVYDQL
jgi:hypothetical protein